MTFSIRWEGKGVQTNRLARLTVRGELSQVSLVNQKVLMYRLGQLIIDEIRAHWSRGLALTGIPAGPPPVGLREDEKAVLEPKAQRKLRRELIKQGLISAGKLKTKGALKPKAAQKRLEAMDAHIKAFKAAERARAAARRREWERRIVNNYKIRSPRFGRTAIHGTVRPRSRFYIPNPSNPALYGSGLMKDSLYCVFVPKRSYTDPATGATVIKESGFQFVVQKNRHTASYRAGLTPAGVGNVLHRVSAVDLNNMTRNYVSWDGTTAHKLFLSAIETAGHLAGLVEGTMGFIL